ncbi:MAG TPA: EVE domain-containing protein [Myxococcales bacterium]|nr:EVE domain-containing protein [Myxococcales bacterium]
MPRNHWLLKTEPSVFSFDDLLAAPGKTTGWDGVRNYQARNYLRDEMKKGDGVLIYHSSSEPTAVVGTAEVVREGHPDPTQFVRGDDHYDPDSRPDDPRWFQVEVRAVEKLPHAVTLERIKRTPQLKAMGLLRRGNRLSVQPVTESEFRTIVKLGQTPG